MDKKYLEKGDHYQDKASEREDEELQTVDGESLDSYGHVPSSRQMPVPEYLERQANSALVQGQRRTDDDLSEAAPPSYEEAIRNEGGPSTDGVMSEEPTEREPLNVPESGAAEGGPSDEGLSSNEIALIMKMREGRDSYLPGDRRRSYEEAMEMEKRKELGPDENNSGLTRINVEEVDTRIDGVETSWHNGERTSRPVSHVEAGTDEPSDVDSNRLVAFLKRQPSNRLILIGLLIFACVCLVLFVGLFPASFVYVDYHEIALKQSKLTNVVNRKEVFYTGCYILGPDTQFVTFQGSVHNVVEEMSVFTLDTIPITIRYSAHYFIRPEEVGQLFTLFMHDYDPVFRKIITSSIRILAGTTFTVDNFRFNRTFVEREIHVMLRKRLGGDCCPSCCPGGCQSNLICNQCKPSNCTQGYHIDVRYFFLMGVTIPMEVFERYLRFTILEIEKEKEFFLQDHAVTTKETQLLTQKIKNEAYEIISKANAERDKVAVLAEADKEKEVQRSYVDALQKMYSSLNVTQEDQKLSLMMVRMLQDQADNLYAGYAYDQNILSAP